jgi:hypothetical protein
MIYQRRTILLLAVLAAAFGICWPAAAMAGQSTYGAVMQLDQPTEIPGYLSFNESGLELMNTFLPKGEYRIEMEPVAPEQQELAPDRAIVRVKTLDGKRILATLMAVVEAPSATETAEIVGFYDTGKGNHPALNSWMLWDANMALRFVYPTEQAIRLAEDSGMAVAAAETAAAGPWTVSKQTLTGLLNEPVTMVGKAEPEVPFPGSDE